MIFMALSFNSQKRICHMLKNDANHNVYEEGTTAKHLICWRSLFAGLLVSLLVFSAATALGVAFGGIGLSDGTTAENAGLFSGLWFLVSAVISLFVGGYFAVRLAKFRTDLVGCAHGFVIAAMFVLLIMNSAATAVSFIAKSAGSIAGGAATVLGAGVNVAGKSPMVQDMVDDSLAGLNLKADPQVVASGVASRLVRGDTEGAKNYLARQSGITPAEADQKIAALHAQLDQAMVKAREATATAMKGTGWGVFLLIVLGAIAAASGGVIATHFNGLSPLARTREEAGTSFTRPAQI
jgi:uncharacterized membrane protein